MSASQAIWSWIGTGFKGLITRHNELLVDQEKQQFRLSFAESKLDCIDRYSASVVGAALVARHSVLIVLPDGRPRRPAFLLAYALLHTWWRNWSSGIKTSRPILYCGVQVGIRGQLNKVSYSGLSEPLSSIFGQQDVRRAVVSGWLDIDQPVSALPRAITVYSPVELRSIVESYSPAWISVDLSDAEEIRWFDELMSTAEEKDIPVLAWSTNPLSPLVREFAAYGHVVKWPFSQAYSGDWTFEPEEDTEILFSPNIVTAIRPILLSGPNVSPITESLYRAVSSLSALGGSGLGTFSQSTIQQHWRLYRQIETMHVPYATFESEAANIWGMTPTERQFETCAKFRGALEAIDPTTAAKLEIVSDLLLDCVDLFRSGDPPFWSKLIELIREETDQGKARLIVFSTNAKKNLFSLALLARHGLTLDDLATNRVWVLSLREFANICRRRYAGTVGDLGSEIHHSLEREPIVVGLPSVFQYSRLWPIFLAEEVQVLAFDFQERALSKRIEQLAQDLTPDLTSLANAISELVPIPDFPDKVTAQSRLWLDRPKFVDISSGYQMTKEGNTTKHLWDGADIEAEMSRLYQLDEGKFDEAPFVDTENDDLVDDGLDPWVDQAIEIRFSGNWIGRFTQTHALNYVDQSSFNIDVRRVLSLRIGDQILIVPYQERQSLYSLVIDRIHKNPAIELHLSVLKRWHAELLNGFKNWTQKNSFGYQTGLERVLDEIQHRGSSITSSLTVKFWVTGVTLCPLDAQDVVRLGDVLDLKFVRAHHGKIVAAATRIRGIHRGVANRLNNWLAEYSSSEVTSHDNETIDDETGLTFGDLRASFLLAEITEMRTVNGPLLRATLGVIEKE